MKTIGRVSLYERVWTEPKRDVARSFGVTYGRLSRLCRRNDIPTPAQGFWNRSPEDRAALKKPLPSPEQDWEIAVEPSAGHVPDDRPAKQRGIPIPEKVTRWHPLIRQTRHVLKDCSHDDYGRFRPGAGCLDILVTKSSRQRAYRAMDTLLKECESRGWSVRVTDSQRPRTIVTVEGGEVAIAIEELVEREDRKLTKAERQDPKWRWAPYCFQRYPRYVRGRFVLKTDWSSDNGRRAWREGGRFSLEYVLKQFIEGLESAGISRREADERAAKAEEERRKRDAERWEQEKAEMREAELVERLLADAESWAKSRTLRDYIGARIKNWRAKGVNTGKRSEAARWVAWASKQADCLDPLVPTGPLPGARSRPKASTRSWRRSGVVMHRMNDRCRGARYPGHFR
ncbi:MAG TPA: hypothetical protein P5567_11615 [Kiritimatiellia bacterium]|nr:hypothetical protein [Kiritimatiellia bacterium]HSA17509.1 hypothetical protein [Kiritimatiellia bacterium]